MKKAVFFGFLLLVIGFVLWQIVAGEFFNPADKLVTKISKENFDWFKCPACGSLFMAEATTRKGYCPYCASQVMLVPEAGRVIGRSVDDSHFFPFFSPKCGNVFFAYETGESGKCPYCGETLALTAPKTIDLEEETPTLIAWTRANFGRVVMGVLGLFAISIAFIYVLMQSRTVLSLKPVQGTVSTATHIELSKWKARKKKITLGDTADNDIVLKDPSLKKTNCVLSFVRVGGKTHAYLSEGSNNPIWINEKLQYNPRLHNRDRVKLGNVVFEVKTKEK